MTINFNIAAQLVADNQMSPELVAVAKDLLATSTAADEASRAQNQLELAQNRAENAALTLAKAQEQLAANTDPSKQATLEQRVQAAQVALDRQTESVSALEEQMQGLNETEDEGGTLTETVVGAYTELNSAVILAQQGVNLLRGAYQATIGQSVDFAQTVLELANESGTSAEEASRMAIVFGDFGVDVGSLNTVVKAFTKDGLEFNLATIEKLAAEYQSIQDPVQRDAFVYATFGRSGQDLNEILSQTPAQLEAMAAAADASGRELSGPAAQSLEDYSKKVQQASDKWNGLTTQLSSNVLLPILTRAMDGFSGLTGIVQLSSIQNAANFRIITQQEAAIRAQAVANGDLFASTRPLTAAESAQLTAEMNVSDAVSRHTQANTTALPVYQDMADRVSTVSQRESDLAAAEAGATAAQAAQDTVTETQIGMMDKLTAQTIYQIAAQGLSADGALQLARQMGLVSDAQFNAASAVEHLKEQHDAGKLSLDQYTTAVATVNQEWQDTPQIFSVAGQSLDNVSEKAAALANDGLGPAARAAEDLANKLAGIPKTVYVDVYENVQEQVLGTPQAVRPGSGPGAAAGTDFIVPPGYPNDSYRLNVQSGERVVVIPPGQAAAPGGVSYYTVNITDSKEGALFREQMRRQQLQRMEHGL